MNDGLIATHRPYRPPTRLVVHNLLVNPILRNSRASFNAPMEDIANGVPKIIVRFIDIQQSACGGKKKDESTGEIPRTKSNENVCGTCKNTPRTALPLPPFVLWVIDMQWLDRAVFVVFHVIIRLDSGMLEISRGIHSY